MVFMQTLKILLIEDDLIETLKFQRIVQTFSKSHKQQNVAILTVFKKLTTNKTHYA